MYREIWLLMLSVGIVLLLVSLILFFVWNVPNLIDEISGNKAKRQIKLMESMNSSIVKERNFPTVNNIDIIEEPKEVVTNLNVEDVETVESNPEEVELEEDEIKTSYLELGVTTYLDKKSSIIIVLEEHCSFL